jgi:FtsH-binding integral membrane protein
MEFYDDKQVTSNATHKDHTVAISIVKVYLYFALGLLITGIMAIGYPWLTVLLYKGDTAGAENFFVWSVIVFLIMFIPLSFATSLASLSSHPALIRTFYILYAVSFGGLMSLVAMYVETTTLMYAFLVTAGAFFFMSMVGVVTKGRINKWINYLITFVFGMAIIAIFNVFVFGNDYLYWIVSPLILLVFLLIVAVDTDRVIKNAQARVLADSDVQCIYSAYSLYSDFIIIFMYILKFMMIFGVGSSRK